MEYCPTEEMWTYHFTKALQGSRFLKIFQVIMNEPRERSVLNLEGDLDHLEIIELER